MKKLLIILLICYSSVLLAQNVPDNQRSKEAPATGANRNNQAQVDANLKAALSLNIPHFSTWTIKNAKDSVGYIMLNTTLNRFGTYRGSGIWDIYITLADIPAQVITATIINHTVGPIGAVAVNDTVAHIGQTYQQVFQNIATQTIHPTYNLPTSSISVSSGSAPGNYPFGFTINATLASNFVQNDGGTLTSTTYKQGSTTVTSVSISSLTTVTSYTVQKGYNTGSCKNNNLGVSDCIVGSGTAPNPAPVVSGTATSPAITYTPTPQIYYGRAASTTATSSELLSAVTLGGNILTQFGHAFPLGITVVASGSNHPFIAVYSTQGTITVIKDINGFDVTSSFPKTTISFTNAYGYTANIDIYTFVTATSSNYFFTTN